MMCGGLSDETRADEATQSICDRVKADAEQKAGMSFKEFKAVSYTKQVVAGMNHFIKVDVGDDGFVHIRVYEPLPYTKQPIQLHEIQLSKSAEDKIEYF